MFSLSLHNKQICIAGPQQVQNMLIASFLEKETGIECQHAKCMGDRICKHDGDGGQPKVILCDCFGKGTDHCLEELQKEGRRIVRNDYLALFNVDPNAGLENQALNFGVRGFFYVTDTLEQITKGLHAIFEGEIWASRKIISSWITSNHPFDSPLIPEKTILTNRENEILIMITGGLSNDQIAEKLCISPYTVKTHIHNIFKKIKVPSRMQAALWAIKNL